MDIHILRRQGLSIRKIAAVSGVSRNAVRRALRSSTPPNGKRERSQGDKLAPFHDQIATWLRDTIKSHWTGARILDELEDLGYKGGRTVLMDYLRRVRPKPATQAEARFYVKPGQHYVEFRVMLSRNRDRFLLVPSHAYPLSIIPPRSVSRLRYYGDP
jgi:transposase